jgi:uncharacterized membrane protein
MAGHMNIGEFHPVLVHFPIVLFTLGLVCDLLNGIGKKEALPVAHWMFIGGAIMCLPTLVSGWEAAEAFPADNPLIPIHRLLAFTTSIAGALYAIFRIAVMRKGWEIHPLYYVVCSVLLMLLVSWTADYGGRIAFGVSLFSLLW